MQSLDNMLVEFAQQKLEKQTRRHFLMDCVAKVGGLAMAPLMFGCDTGSSAASKGLNLSQRDLNPLAPLPPPFAA
ncbi:MAG: sulfatase, partial [Algoriphagus sp.]